MTNPWDAEAAAQCRSALALRAYSSRLLGSDPELVLLGGGNTSVKLTGEDGDTLLYVKGTGADLADVEERDFTPLKLVPVRAMLREPHLDYASMMRELARHIVAQEAPRPSIETLLHAALPARYVEHTHADNILAVTNTPGGEALARKVFGDIALVVPYRHSGFALAKICSETWAARATPQTIGIILMHHGAVACGDTAQESYSNMLRLVARAEEYLGAHGATDLPRADPPAIDIASAHAIGKLRRELSLAADYPLLLGRCKDPVATAFGQSTEVRRLAAQSPATPQHAVFARRIPMCGRDVGAFAAGYRDYLGQIADGILRLDAAPRIVFDPELGMLAAGITPWHLDAAATSYCHSIATMLRAEAHDRYLGLPPLNVLEAELEYGGFEHRIAADRKPDVALAGTVTLLAHELGTLLQPLAKALRQGSGAVAVVDASSGESGRDRGVCVIPQACADSAESALFGVIERFGGIDALVCTEADSLLIEEALPWLALSPSRARVVVCGGAGRHSREVRESLERCRAADIEVVALDAGLSADPVRCAADVAATLAIPSNSHRRSALA